MLKPTNKPIYLIVAEDPEVKGKIAYYQSQALIESSNYLDFKGYLLTKECVIKLVNDPYASLAKMELKMLNRKIPWLRIIRIENLTYKSQGENNE